MKHFKTNLVLDEFTQEPDELVLDEFTQEEFMRKVKICFGGGGGGGGGGDLFPLANARTIPPMFPLMCSEASRACGLLVKHQQTRPAAGRVL